MEWAVLPCVLFASCLSIQAEPVVSSVQGNKSINPEPAALLNSGTPEREGALLQLKDYMDQRDAVLKDRLTESYTNLKELLKQGDSVLKDQLVESVAQVKEQRKEGDERLKEELDEDVAWLKDKLAKGQTRMKQELAEEEAKMKEELAEQREALRKLKNIVEQLSRSSGADLEQQMADFRTELQSTKLQLQTTQTELRTSQESLQSTQESLQSTQESLQSTQESLQSTQESLQSTQESLQSTQESLQTTQESLQSTQADLQSTQESLQSTQADLQTTQEKVYSVEQELHRTREQLQSEVQASTALMTQLQTAEDEILSLKVRVNSSESCCQSLLESSEQEGNDSSAVARKVSCDDGYELVCNRCLIAVAERVTYTTARLNCKQMQGQLVMTKSHDEINCIATHMRDRGSGWTWVGADDMEEPGVFRWSDGTVVADHSPLWHSGEPDKFSRGNDCVNFSPDGAGLWDDPCRASYQYICQKDQARALRKLKVLRGLIQFYHG